MKICIKFKIELLVVLLMFVSCGTVKYVPVNTIKTEYKTKIDSVRDSVFLHDSTLVNVYTKGDTVYHEQTRWKYKYRFINQYKNDTVVKIDSIPYVVKTTVEKKEPFKKRASRMALSFLAGLAIGVFYKPIYNVVKRVVMKGGA